MRYILHSCSLHVRLCENSSHLVIFLWFCSVCHSLPWCMKTVYDDSATLLFLYSLTGMLDAITSK